MPPSIDQVPGLRDPASKPFVAHLEDLRRTLLACALFLVAGIALAAPFAPIITSWLIAPIETAGLADRIALQEITVGGPIGVAIRVILWSGVIGSLPFTTIALARFIFPGLTAQEKHAVTRGGALSIVLFALGVWLGYRWTLPYALNFMVLVGDWMHFPAAIWIARDYVSLVLKMLLAFGLAFQLPVVTLALGYVGLVSSRTLRDKRRHIIVGILVLAMALTPQDPFSMLLMAIPLVVLFEMCIWAIWAHERAGRS